MAERNVRRPPRLYRHADADEVGLHRIEHAPAGALEPQEVRQDREQDGRTEGDKEQAVDRQPPLRLNRRIIKYFALDVNHYPQQTVRNERHGDPAPAALRQPPIRTQHTALDIRRTDAGGDEEIRGIQ